MESDTGANAVVSVPSVVPAAGTGKAGAASGMHCSDGSADRCSQHPRHQRNRRKTAGTGEIAGVCLCISEH